MTVPKYKRVTLKLSGEALSGEHGYGIDFGVVNNVAAEICRVLKMGVQVSIVVGGGNIWRGRSGEGMDRTTADHMGMLATVINALALQDAIESKGAQTRVQTAIEMRQIAEPYIRRRAMRHLEKRRVVIFACGTGNPYFSTDTAAALRAAEMDAEALLLAKRVDGIYDKDPSVYPDAKKINKISYIEFINRGLMAMDATAITLCMENKIPILVFGLDEPDAIYNVISEGKAGTIVS